MSFPISPSVSVEFTTESAFEQLGDLCRDVFASFSRSDQKRWGEVYVRGLATVAGRKSVRRIAEDVVGWRADQSLQQFVNQSPWAWEPVRGRLAGHVDAVLQPQAWVVSDAVFPKHGTKSAGVAVQYAPSVGHALNCQLGVALCLAGEPGGYPVNWRLLMPTTWEQDAARRWRTQIPAAEQTRTRWQHVLDMVDEALLDWELAPRPLLVEAHHETQVEPLLTGLEERGLLYLVQVGPNTPVLPGNSMSVAEAVALAVSRGTYFARLEAGANGGQGLPFVVVGLSGTRRQSERGAGRPYVGSRRIVARWSPRKQSVEAAWLTTMPATQLTGLIGLTSLGHRTTRDLERMYEHCGLRHFEGRSFRGWHHHVTLASVANAAPLLTEQADEVWRPGAG